MIEEDWLVKYVPMDGNEFVDVGANVLAWSKWLAPGYKHVHAVEPFQEAIAAAGPLPSNVTVHPFGAWATEAQIHFGIYSPGKLLFAQEGIDSYFADIGTNGPADANSLVLPCRTLDLMVSEKDSISFVKVDVEGSELQVLLGAPQIIRASHPYMIIEVHSVKNAPEIEKILKAEKYSWEIVRNPFYDEHRHVPHWTNHYWMICS